MRRSLPILFSLLCFSAIFFCGLPGESAENDVASENAQLKSLLEAESRINLSVGNSEPNKRITNLMGKVDAIGQKLMSMEPTDDVLTLSETSLAMMAVLRERRVYAYMLWAEGLLEGSKSGRYSNLSSLDQNTLVNLYCKLSEINISIINENMLSREIISRLAEIYELLSAQNKQIVRVRAIQMQRDGLSKIENVPMRKTLDDF